MFLKSGNLMGGGANSIKLQNVIFIPIVMTYPPHSWDSWDFSKIPNLYSGNNVSVFQDLAQKCPHSSQTDLSYFTYKIYNEPPLCTRYHIIMLLFQASSHPQMISFPWRTLVTPISLPDACLRGHVSSKGSIFFFFLFFDMLHSWSCF